MYFAKHNLELYTAVFFTCSLFYTPVTTARLD